MSYYTEEKIDEIISSHPHQVALTYKPSEVVMDQMHTWVEEYRALHAVDRTHYGAIMRLTEAGSLFAFAQPMMALAFRLRWAGAHRNS